MPSPPCDLYQPAMKTRMAELEQWKAETKTRLLRDAPADLPNVHPNVGEARRVPAAAQCGRASQALIGYERLSVTRLAGGEFTTGA
jgi:hypothetical protein